MTTRDSANGNVGLSPLACNIRQDCLRPHLWPNSEPNRLVAPKPQRARGFPSRLDLHDQWPLRQAVLPLRPARQREAQARASCRGDRRQAAQRERATGRVAPAGEAGAGGRAARWDRGPGSARRRRGSASETGAEVLPGIWGVGDREASDS